MVLCSHEHQIFDTLLKGQTRERVGRREQKKKKNIFASKLNEIDNWQRA